MKILITGGTGTLGHALVRVLKGNDITVISRSEVKQVEMKEIYPEVEFKICDVRDYKALRLIVKNFDLIYHLAALKHVPICEKQPIEAIKTNVYGTMNVLKAAKRDHCPVIFMSTDKAENPTSVYGNTKAIAESCVLQSENAVVRTGNIFGSSGSVIQLFIKSVQETNQIRLTNGEMTRFFISANDLAVYLSKVLPIGVLNAPELKSFRMKDIAEAVRCIYGNSNTEIIETGIRPGEKMHETLLGKSSLDCLGREVDLARLFNDL